ncbi:hypothetical protein IZ6_26240 [Terrihabitans soli]|uniref:DUF6460 domain-containing protein n=1 Tax=Terrihabitans soli TaxID=708113 RepID=A0A6S6QS42_9HYPH|nr:DUF6460 domain-containing protein [Terrihabitans soli]BCJ91889.1 hypothetical protein IZ6_26240 [Terrihabitans soli]
MTDSPNAPAPAPKPAAPSDPLTRFFGGPPLWVLAKLVMLSVVIGVILAVLGLDAWALFYGLQDLFYSLFDNLWDAIDTVLRWFLLGAVIVFPIWLIARLMKVGR